MIALAARPGVSSVPDGRPGLLQSLTQTRAASGPLNRVTDQPGGDLFVLPALLSLTANRAFPVVATRTWNACLRMSRLLSRCPHSDSY